MPKITIPSFSDEDLDHTPMSFGKYRGESPNSVARHDPAYLVWAHDTVQDKPTCSRLLRNACERDVREQEADWSMHDDFGDLPF